MDTTLVKQQVQTARDVLAAKGAPREGTAAGHLILALEELTRQLDNQFGYSQRDFFGGVRAGGKTNMVRDALTATLLNSAPYEEVPQLRYKGILHNADS